LNSRLIFSLFFLLFFPYDWVVSFLVETKSTSFLVWFPHILPFFHSFGHFGRQIVSIASRSQFSQTGVFFSCCLWAILFYSRHAYVRERDKLQNFITRGCGLATEVKNFFIVANDPGVAKDVADCHSVFWFLHK